MREYTCERCDGRFTPNDNWTEADVDNEYKRTFDYNPDGELATICDNCYEEFKSWVIENKDIFKEELDLATNKKQIHMLKELIRLSDVFKEIAK